MSVHLRSLPDELERPPSEAGSAAVTVTYVPEGTSRKASTKKIDDKRRMGEKVDEGTREDVRGEKEREGMPKVRAGKRAHHSKVRSTSVESTHLELLPGQPSPSS